MTRYIDNIDWRRIENLCIEHAKKVIIEAKEWRRKGVSAYSFSKKIKSKWEKELYSQFLEVFGGEFSLLGKDAGYIGKKDSNLVLLLDLFDGSINFLLGSKYFSYNVSIIDRKGIVFALCIDLETFDCFSAYRDQGAYLNNNKLNGPSSFTDRIICSNVVIKDLPFLHFGCASLELCLLAKGAADIVLGQAGVPDIAAAMLIVSETGATVTDWQFKKIRIPISNTEVLTYIAGEKEAVKTFLGRFQNLNDIVTPMPSVWPNIVKRGKIGIDYE